MPLRRPPVNKQTVNPVELLNQISLEIEKHLVAPDIQGYVPHEKQNLFHQAPQKGRLFLGGNRAGKTTAGVAEDIFWLKQDHPYRDLSEVLVRGIPTRGRAIVVDFNILHQVLIPEYKRWMPPSLLKDGSWDKSFDKSRNILTLVNGATLDFKTYEQDMDKHSGTSRHFCVDDETKILAKQGWADINSLSPGEEILTRNENGTYEWKSVNFIYRAVSDKMYRLKSRNNFDALVTADHRWLVRDKRTGKEYYTTTEKLKTTEQLIISADMVEISGKSPYSDEFVALVGWLITDGSVTGYNYNIGQSLSYNGKKCSQIEALLDAIGADYYINDAPYKNGVMRYFQIRGQLRDEMRAVVGPDKNLPYWFINSLTSEQLEILLDAIILGDGQYLHSGSWTVTATRQQHIDAITYLAVLCGYRVNNYKTKHSWSVIKAKSWTGERYDYRRVSVDSLDISIEDYGREVWCPNTDNSNFVAYRGGRTFLTGNCHFDEEAPEHIFNENMLRLLDTDGHWWMTMTPLLGVTWLYDKFKMDEHPDEESYVEGNVYISRINTLENPNLSKAAIASTFEGMSEDEIKSRQEGRFVEVGGLVFKNFDKSLHVIEPTIPPKTWEWYMSLDSGWNNPTAILWHAVSPEGMVITFDEIYQKETTVSEFARMIKEREKRWGKQPFLRTGDPAIRQTREVTGTSVQQEYASHDIYLSLDGVPTGAGSVDIGIQKMQTYMGNKKMADGTVTPAKWFITENCVHTIKELRKLRWATFNSKNLQNTMNPQEKIHKKDDHTFDSARYFFTLLPDPRPDAPGSLNPATKQVRSWQEELLWREQQEAAGNLLDLSGSSRNNIESMPHTTWDVVESYRELV